ncbi:hypothetical protein EJB05_18486, partial [Eragrostis curvula]
RQPPPPPPPGSGLAIRERLHPCFLKDFSMTQYVLLKRCIEDILSVIKPVEDDRKKRLRAIQELTDSVNSVGALRGAAVKPFGSFVSNLYAKSGDLDVSVDLRSGSVLPRSKTKKQNVLRELMRALQIRGVARSVHFIPNARVPVLQYVSNHFGISCDISINNYPGQIKSRIFYWINTIDDRFGDIVLLVKEWAKAQNINDPKNGTLNSYSLCLLVLFHFQTCEPAILPPLKDIYDGNVAAHIAGSFSCDEKHVDEVCLTNIARFLRRNTGQRNQSSVSKLLASFFLKVNDCFRGIGDLSGQVISTYTGRFERIQDNRSWMAKSYSLFIEDPFERPDNAARTVGAEEMQLIGCAFDYVSYRFTAGALADRNELVSLLCTPTVRSILGYSVRDGRYKGYTESTASSQKFDRKQISSYFTEVYWPPDSTSINRASDCRLYQSNNRSRVYTSTRLEPAIPYQSL